MKKQFVNLSFISLLALVSCNKKAEKELTLRTEVEKIETILEAGKEKDESRITYLPKIETIASAELQEKIMGQLNRSYSKTNVDLARGTGLETIGVFKDVSCGSYREMVIKMDCEDNNSKSKATGWTGASYVDGGGNAIFSICLVTFGQGIYPTFGVSNPTNYSLGYMSLNRDPGTATANNPFDVIAWDRGFDNEDGSNLNSVKINNVSQTMPFTTTFDGVQIGVNSTLSFLLPRMSPTTISSIIPGLTSFGLIGSYGSNQGNILTDDEDGNNTNYFSSPSFVYSSGPNPQVIPLTQSHPIFTGRMAFGTNTRIYLSKFPF